MQANIRGHAGETFAANVLQRDGMQILARNYHSRFGEVDIIAADHSVVAFVEVKTRRIGNMVSPAQSVTRSKQKKIIQTALCYLQEFPCMLQPRFDVFCIETDRNGTVQQYEHLKGAFDCEAYSG